jgi:hypothetical protein
VVFIISIYKKWTAINPVQAAPREGKAKEKERKHYLSEEEVGGFNKEGPLVNIVKEISMYGAEQGNPIMQTICCN